MLRSNLLYLSAAAIALAAAAQPAAGQAVAPPPVPTDIQVPAGNTAYLKGYAMGTQNYVCLPGDAGLAWKFQGPQATVFYKFRWLGSDVLQQIITHFLSPNPMEAGAPARATWQSSLDTSAVWAKKVKESSDPAYVAAGAIPWFLLQTTGVRRRADGRSVIDANHVHPTCEHHRGTSYPAHAAKPEAFSLCRIRRNMSFIRPTGHIDRQKY